MLDDLCAFYMACGVPCEMFWDGDYTMLRHYVAAHRIKQREMNEQLWLQGRYVFDAVSAVAANVLSKRGAAPVEYLKEPYQIQPSTESEKKAEDQRRVTEMRNQLNQWISASMARKKRQGGEKNSRS